MYKAIQKGVKISKIETNENAIFDPLVYKKINKKPRNFLFKYSRTDTSSLEFIPALALSFLAWPVMIWYWTKNFIYPIFSILGSLTLFAFSIYFWIFDGSPSFYLCTGYVVLLVSALLWCFGAQNVILSKYFDEPEYPKTTIQDYIAQMDVDSDKFD